MKTILVMSSGLDKSIEHVAWGQPLGLAYIAACIRDISDVVIIDCDVDVEYTKTLMHEINTNDDLIVGFSSNTYSYPDALNLAEMVKKYNRTAHINFGGYHATPLANLILKNRTYVDSVIRGDGEIPFRQLVNAILNGGDLSGVGSLTYRNQEIIISNPDAPKPDLDSLPYPARDLLPMGKYFENLKNSMFSGIYGVSNIVFVNSTRGCPNRCDYCCLFNRELRLRNPYTIVDEIEYVMHEYRSDLIYLVGDNLNLDWKWLLAICEEIINRKLNVKWMGVTANPENINKQLVDALEKSGCISLFFGFESASKKILDAVHRNYTTEKYSEIIEVINSTEIITVGSFILGSPGESEDTLRDTRNFVEKSNIKRISVSILAPLPGTEIYAKTCSIMPELKTLDIVPVEDAKKMYIEQFCKVDYQRLEQERIYLSEKFNISLDLY